MSPTRLSQATLVMIIGNLAIEPIWAERTECGNHGLWCLNGGKCDPSTYSCVCNDSWINGPTFTGGQCEIETADCGHGVWCVENQGTCMYRASQWAHGDGAKECEDGGGTCQQQVASKGAEHALICVGGVKNNENCNFAVGCDCNDGFYGSHCEEDIIICDIFSNGNTKFWCLSRGSTRCSSKKSCQCIDGYTGKHCSSYVGLDDSESNGEDTEMIIAVSVLLIVCLSVSLVLFIMYRREKQGKPIFSPLDESLLHGHGGNGQVHPRPEANVKDFLPPSNLENHLHVPSKETEENEIQLERMRI